MIEEPEPDDCSDFYEALGPKSAKDRAALIWRTPRECQLVSGGKDEGRRGK